MKAPIKTLVQLLSVVLSVIMVVMSMPLSAMAVSMPKEDDSANDSDSSSAVGIFEYTDRREENAKHFRLPDGSFVVAQYDQPVHVLGSDGTWSDIDNTLLVSADTLSTKDKRVSFARTLFEKSTLFTLTENGYAVSMTMNNLLPETVGVIAPIEKNPYADELRQAITLDHLTSRVRYENIQYGIDLEYILDSLNVKENIIVKNHAPNYAYSFTLSLQNLQAELSETGDVFLTDSETGKVVYTIPAPIAYDAKGICADSKCLSYKLSANDPGNYTLAVTVDSSWMNDPERAYPVTIDPSVSMSTSTVLDKDISSSIPTFASSTGSTIWVSDTWRSYWKTSSLPVLPDSAYIVKATLSMATANSVGAYVGAYRVLTSWDSTLSWNQMQNQGSGQH